MFDINQCLTEIESRHAVIFEPSVRTAVEARAWLTRLGLPFTLSELVRAVLRNGFASGSVFAAFRLALSMPGRRECFMLPSARAAQLSKAISHEVFDSLDLAARIRRGLSVGSRLPVVTRDSVMMAIARLSPDAAIGNLVPRDMAERSISAVRAVAARALSDNVGPSRHHLLRSPRDVERYLQARGHFAGWHLTRLSLNPSSIDENIFVHLSLQDSLSCPSDLNTPEWEIPGRRNELYLYGVSCVKPMITQENRIPEMKIIQAQQSNCDKQHKSLVLRTLSSSGTNLPPIITFEYSKELTVAEHCVHIPSSKPNVITGKLGVASSA